MIQPLWIGRPAQSPATPGYGATSTRHHTTIAVPRIKSRGGRTFLSGMSHRQERRVAKGQKKSNKEVRKPKAEKPKPAVAASSFAMLSQKKK